MPVYMLAFIIAAGVALLVTPGVICLAGKTGAMDAPDARKVHKKPIPRIGGIGIYVAFMVAILSVLAFTEVSPEVLYEIIGLLVGGSIIFIVGLIDDYVNLPAKVKLLGQIIAACVLVFAFDVRIDFITDPFGDYIYLEFLAIPATIFWLVGLTNTVNLIDGLDGLAAGVSTIASITIFLVALQQGIILVAVLTAAPRAWTYAIPLTLVALGVAGFYSHAMQVRAGKIMPLGVVYIGCVIFVAATSLTGALLTSDRALFMFFLGGLCFSLSDNMLVVLSFGRNDSPYRNAVLHVLYYMAQVFIALSILFYTP